MSAAPTSATTTPPPRQRRRRRRRTRRLLLTGGGALGVALAVVVAATHAFGPRFGVYLVPPSPERYAHLALDHLDGGYHTDDPQWAHDRAALLAAGRTADDLAQLYPALQRAVRTAGGEHSSFTTPQGAHADTGGPPTAPAPSVTRDGGVTTVALPGMTDLSPEAQQRYADVVADGVERAAATTCGWVVDLRGNTGGTMYPMLSAVTALLPDGPALSFRTRRGSDTAVTVQEDGVGLDGRTEVGVGPRGKVVGNPVAVLQDEWTASSGEAVLTAFRGLDDVESFGAPSAGYTSANSTYRLFDGAQLVLTESVYVDRDGTVLDEVPVVADHPGTSASADTDARSWLAANGCR